MSIILKITFYLSEPEKSIIETNAKPEALDEIFSCYMRSQMGAGKDDSPPTEKDIYSIEINLDLSDDSITVKSDTGNKGLTCGIIRHIWPIIERLTIKSL